MHSRNDRKSQVRQRNDSPPQGILGSVRHLRPPHRGKAASKRRDEAHNIAHKTVSAARGLADLAGLQPLKNTAETDASCDRINEATTTLHQMCSRHIDASRTRRPEIAEITGAANGNTKQRHRHHTQGAPYPRRCWQH